MPELKLYTALVRLRFISGGELVKVAPGEIFSLDGDEGIDIGMLLRLGQAREFIPKEVVKDGKKTRKSG